MSNNEEKANEIKEFSKARALKWQAVAAQLSKVIDYMLESGTDYGTVWEHVSDAYCQAQNERARYWADYYAADRIAAGGQPTLYSKK